MPSFVSGACDTTDVIFGQHEVRKAVASRKNSPTLFVCLQKKHVEGRPQSLLGRSWGGAYNVCTPPWKLTHCGTASLKAGGAAPNSDTSRRAPKLQLDFQAQIMT
jgi:hypothetical protein